MRVGVLGINHKSAEIEQRESIAKACLKRLSKESSIAEKYSCVLLSTCHRTEIYFSSENLAEAHSELLNLLREEIFIPFEHKLYAYFGCDTFLHLAKVTAGLDSVIIAESEIQRQVKIAYEETLLHYSLPSCMHYLFQKSLKMGKKIRSHFSLTSGVTLEKIIFHLSSKLFSDLKRQRILFLGNSEINRKIIQFFRKKSVANFTLCTRSLHSAQGVVDQLLSWNELDQWSSFDVIIAGTNAPQYMIRATDAQEVKTRLIFDLGIPRNIDPKLSKHPLITLLNMEELSVMMDCEQRKNREGMDQAEMMLFEDTQRYVYSYHEKEKKSAFCFS